MFKNVKAWIFIDVAKISVGLGRVCVCGCVSEQV